MLVSGGLFKCDGEIRIQNSTECSPMMSHYGLCAYVNAVCTCLHYFLESDSEDSENYIILSKRKCWGFFLITSYY